MDSKIFCLFITFTVSSNAFPATNTTTSTETSTGKGSLISGNPSLVPENEPPEFPNISEMVEIKQEDIPEGTWVLEVEELVSNHTNGESMDTANNVVFRPLFRYREKQSLRRNGGRYRRRYYVPRRSYKRQSGYYRPYRSVPSYYNPYRYYGGSYYY